MISPEHAGDRVMNKNRFYLLLVIVALAIPLVSGCFPPEDPLHGNLKVYPGSSEESVQSPASPPQSNSPLGQTPAPTERHIVITESNSVFSIGLPAGYKEERTVITEKPVDFWFEYLSADMSLEVNGAKVEIPTRRTSAKPGYTTAVTSFSYVMVNLSSQPLSYNLRITPSTQGDQVPARTTEKWTAPGR